MRLALYAFSLCLLGLVLGANVPDIGFDDMPLRAGLSNEISGRSGAGGIWNGKDYVVCWTFDDGANDAALVWADTAAVYGIRFTVYPSASDTAGAGTLDWSEMQGLVAAGHEVGSTGRWHNTGGGGTGEGLLGYASTDYNAIPDSLRWDIGPWWVEQITGVAPTSYGIDLGPENYECATVFSDSNYSCVRAGYYYSSSRGYSPQFDGADRWDGLAPLRIDQPSPRFGIAGYPTTSDSEPTIAIFGNSATEQSQATIEERCAAALAWSDANGNAPIVLIAHDNPPMSNDEFGYAAAYFAGRGDVWQTTVTNMWDEYMSMSGIGYVRPPYWAPYARLEGQTAATQFWVGPTSADALYNARTDTTDAATNRAAFSNGRTISNFTDYASGSVCGEWDYSTKTSVGSTSVLEADFQEYPMDGTESFGVVVFQIDELVGKTIQRAEVWFRHILYTFDFETAEEGSNYACVIGVTNEDFLVGVESTTMCYDYSSGTTPWATDLDNIKRNSEFGWVYPYLSGTDTEFQGVEVTEYIEERAGEPAMFLWHGLNEGGTTGSRIIGHENGTVSYRPVLRVWYLD